MAIPHGTNSVVRTGRKDAKGRMIMRGTRGGVFVINSKGNRVSPVYKNFLRLDNMLTAHVRRR